MIEDLETKRRLFAELESIVGEQAILATNTSSLSIAAIAAACRRPERVAGFHFFNPAPVMKVVEVIAAARTDTSVCDALASLSERFGHAPVRAADTPGFIVNHAGRGYVTEGLRDPRRRNCEPAVLDAVLRDACGFKLGPCELLDLTGLDVSHPVMESIYHQYYEEPRYRPQVVTQRMLEAGLLGRKRGAGFYRYVDGQQVRPPRPDRPSINRAARLDRSEHSPELCSPGVAPRWRRVSPSTTAPRPAADSLIVVTPIGGTRRAPSSPSDLDASRTVGFDALFPGKESRCLFANPGLADEWRERARGGVRQRRHRRLSGARFSRASSASACSPTSSTSPARSPSSGSLRPRTSIAPSSSGLGYPHGPLAWGDAIGAATIRRILDELLGDDRRPALPPDRLARRRAALGLSLCHLD